MNCFESYLVELLQGYISYNNKPVEVVKRFSNAPSLPVITLDTSAGVTTDYVYYDTDDVVETVYYHRKANINISLWCNTDVQKEELTGQILSAYYDEKTNHYRYCSNYDDGICATTNTTCAATTIHNWKTIKNKCPDPDALEYESLMEKHHICKGTVIIEPPFDMDEFDRKPPLLRAIFRSSAEYDEPVRARGSVIEDIELDGVEIFEED